MRLVVAARVLAARGCGLRLLTLPDSSCPEDLAAVLVTRPAADHAVRGDQRRQQLVERELGVGGEVPIANGILDLLQAGQVTDVARCRVGACPSPTAFLRRSRRLYTADGQRVRLGPDLLLRSSSSCERMPASPGESSRRACCRLRLRRRWSARARAARAAPARSWRTAQRGARRTSSTAGSRLRSWRAAAPPAARGGPCGARPWPGPRCSECECCQCVTRRAISWPSVMCGLPSPTTSFRAGDASCSVPTMVCRSSRGAHVSTTALESRVEGGVVFPVVRYFAALNQTTATARQPTRQCWPFLQVTLCADRGERPAPSAGHTRAPKAQCRRPTSWSAAPPHDSPHAL